jgi:predicted amidophosphoribosyltransferase
VSLLAPPACLICRVPLALKPAGPALCRRCRAAIEAAPGARLTADGIDGGFAALPYTGAGRSLVAALKFGRLRSAAELAAALIEARAPPGALDGTLSPWRRERGTRPPTRCAAATCGGSAAAAGNAGCDGRRESGSSARCPRSRS